MLDLAKLPNSGQTTLWDGLTGEKFDQTSYSWNYLYVKIKSLS